MKQNRRPAFSAPVRPAAQSAFTLIELLTVIAVMGILAGLLVGLAPAAMKRARESRVRSELQALEAAIESYKAKFGVYPPDGLALGANGTPLRDSNGGLVVRPELNPLYYELTGVIVKNAFSKSGYFQPMVEDIDGRILASDLLRYFGRDGFVNATTDDKKRSLFRMDFKESASANIFLVEVPQNPDLHVLAVGWAGDAHRPKQRSGLSWPANKPQFPSPIPSNPQLNPWRYVSSNPVNNPGRYDLWAEYIEGNEKKIIGNWRH